MHYEELIKYLRYAIVSRRLFDLFEKTDPETLTDIQRAVRFFYLQKNCYGGLVRRRNFCASVQDGSNYNPEKIPELISKVHERLLHTQLECLPYEDIFKKYDRTSTLPRSYTYDDLGRLTSASTPESGTVTSYYTDAFGNACSSDPSSVCRTIDARGIIKTFTYNDPLNRLTGVSYSDNFTPSVNYTYDTGGQAAFALGRLTKIIEDVSNATAPNAQTFTYDNLGRVTAVTHTISGTNYPVSYGYNASGQVTSITYPSGRIVQPSFDGVGRLAQVVDAANSVPYLSINGSDYNGAGEIRKIVLGNGINGLFSYNDHLQVSTIRYYNPSAPTGTADVLNLGYDYTSTSQPNNNGQIQAIHYYTAPGAEDVTRSERFAYDAWLRLSQSQTLDTTGANTWSLKWAYDRLGNRLSQSLTGGTASIGQPNFIVDPTTNRIVGYCYDADGNLTDETACPSAGTHKYSYDGANRLTQINGGAAAYTYFGQLRIKKTNGDGTTISIYSEGKPIAEYAPGAVLASPLREYIYAGSQLLASIAGKSITYHHPDHLSNRAETDSTGNVLRRAGNLPYGESWYDSASAEKWKFTTYERDLGTGETGLDYAMFRYYSSGSARFLNADLLSGTIQIPQSLNKVAYVFNDPIDLIDPDGLHSSMCLDPRPGPNRGNPIPCSELHMALLDGSIFDWMMRLLSDFGHNLGDDWDVRAADGMTVCSENGSKTNNLQIRVVRADPGVKGNVTKVQGSAATSGLPGEETTMGVTLRNNGNLIPQVPGKDDPFGQNGPAPNAAYLQYGANAGATVTLDLTITVQTTNLLGVPKETPVSKDNVKIIIKCFVPPTVKK